MNYCKSFTYYSRRQTSLVNIGGIPLGENCPIRVQTMTNTLTADTAATQKQIISSYQSGAEYVRVTIPSKRDIENLGKIIHELRYKKCSVPVIADIHFNPEIARLAAGVADKIRINPGNFNGKKSTENTVHEMPEHYMSEFREIKKEFLKLLEVCKQHNTALRIGVNHGSLAQRIIDRFGDTPEGMVESAMEFIRICRDQNFNNAVVSMKSSNPLIMIYATRLLVLKMEKENVYFPVHLGVTEAGEGEDGRIKSAAGIGALLHDGIGDTIRVSLTEDPEKEIPVAQKIIQHINERNNNDFPDNITKSFFNSFEYYRRKTKQVLNVGGSFTPVVGFYSENITRNILREIGWTCENSTWIFEEQSPDFIIGSFDPSRISWPQQKIIIIPYSQWKTFSSKNNFYPFLRADEFMLLNHRFEKEIFILAEYINLSDQFIGKLKKTKNGVLILNTTGQNRFAEQRGTFYKLIKKECSIPVIILGQFKEQDEEYFQVKSASDIGSAFIDGFGDGIILRNDDITPRKIIDTSFGILQATRTRISKTEYISCPSCGRTMFDIQKTTALIREKTSHLKGLKIGIMGCIVNGLGEMADAHYGYIGMGKGKIALYKEKQQIKKNIPEQDAVDELIKLLKENGDWKEPSG